MGRGLSQAARPIDHRPAQTFRIEFLYPTGGHAVRVVSDPGRRITR
jgi:hypothetical protein